MAIEDATHNTGENPSGPLVMLVNADGTPFTGYAEDGGGIGGHLLGQVCHNHVLTEVYSDFDGEGHLAGMHTHDVGSC
ncbi:hypothetical protein [Microbacterium kunmingense]|uniref:hypothetical protein n=1 Tax=Microbacterium kunmingense TaxID=2915939 RepID=UPI0020036D1E|nr:hypothetical protein [Microbacterium kunmingense]